MAGVSRFVGALGLVVSLSFVAASPAWAHADYRGSTPSDGATVSEAPSEVVAEFTEPPAPGSTLRIFDPCGAQVDSGSYSYQGFPLNRMSTSMSSDKAGRFSVEWTVISAADGHTTRGFFSFDASQGASCPGSDGSDGSDGSGGSGSEGSGTAARSSTQTATEEASVSNDGSGTSSKSKKGSAKRNATKATGKNDGSSSDGTDARGATLVQEERPEDEEERAASDDIPVDWLIVGLCISALIGAVGGRVYAGIVSPRR